MKNFESIEYISVKDVITLLEKANFTVNLIYKNSYIELKFENVKILYESEVNYNGEVARKLLIHDSTHANNMNMYLYIDYNYFQLDKENSNKKILYLNYDENISFEIIKEYKETSLYTNKKRFNERVVEPKNENTVLNDIRNLRYQLVEKDDYVNRKKFEKQDKNLLNEDSFKYEQGKRKLFYDPRYNFIAEGCYAGNKVFLDDEIRRNGFGNEVSFNGRKDLDIKLNTFIFRDEIEEIKSYTVNEENLTPLYYAYYQNKERIEEEAEIYKTIDKITRVESLDIIEISSDTENIKEILFNEKIKKETNSEHEFNEFGPQKNEMSSDIDVNEFDWVEDDDIPF